LTQDYGLLFFYEGKYQASEAFALIVQQFVSKYDWKMTPISVDGIVLKSFAQSKNATVKKQWSINECFLEEKLFFYPDLNLI